MNAITVGIDVYECPKCGEQVAVAHEISIYTLKNGKEVTIDRTPDPICICGSQMFQSDFLHVLNKIKEVIR